MESVSGSFNKSVFYKFATSNNEKIIEAMINDDIETAREIFKNSPIVTVKETEPIVNTETETVKEEKSDPGVQTREVPTNRNQRPNSVYNMPRGNQQRNSAYYPPRQTSKTSKNNKKSKSGRR